MKNQIIFIFLSFYFHFGTVGVATFEQSSSDEFQTVGAPSRFSETIICIAICVQAWFVLYSLSSHQSWPDSSVTEQRRVRRSSFFKVAFALKKGIFRFKD
jgi:uncharacterized membrane protein